MQAETTSEVVDPTLLLIFIGILVVTYALIIYQSFNKHFAAFIGGILVLIAVWAVPLFLGIQLFTNEELVEHLAADLIILAIIVGNLIVVDIGSKSGLFHFISIKILKLTRGSPTRLMLYMGLLSVVLSVVVNNISAILISASLTILACQKLELNPQPYIMSQMILVNVGGLYTLVSSVPNIIIGTTLGDGFGYLEFLFPYGIVIASILILTSFLSYRVLLPAPKGIATKEDREAIVATFDEWAAVTDKRFFYATTLILLVMILLFVSSTILGIDIVTISLAGAVAILLVSRVDFDTAIEAVDWPLLAFFTGLFTVISALDLIGAIGLLAQILGDVVGSDVIIAAIIILWVSAVMSGIVDNIVIAAALAPVIVTISAASGMSIIVLGWALIIGANLGGDFTPIGSPSNVIGISILAKRTGKTIGWGGWRIPATVTLIHLTIATFLITLMAILIG